MKAIRVYAHGGPDALRYEDVPMPEPAAGEVRVKLAAAGLNFIDIYQRTGQYKMPLPFTPGQEGGGTVDATGDGVTEVQIGQRVVYCMTPGAYAQFAVVPAWRVVPVPDGLDINTAVALMVQGMTAHYLAVSTFELNPGHTALIHAAAGGAGHLLVQIAKHCGARVIATAGTPAKADLARSAGADAAIVYTETDFEPEVKRLTNGMGVDVVYDSVGKTTFAKGLNCLRTRGMMVLWGQASGAVEALDPQLLNQKGSLYLTRPSLGHYITTRDELLWRAGELFRWASSSGLEVRIDQTFPLEQAADAQRYMEARLTKGKVLLIP